MHARIAPQSTDNTPHLWRAGKRYFQHTKLGDIIDAYPYKAGLTDVEQLEQRNAREAFLDFLWGILVCPALDPS